jgi:hypothetical protein
VKPHHVDVADFLQEISTEEGAGYLEPGHKHLTIDGFVNAYMASDMYKDIVRILDDKKVNFIVHFQCSVKSQYFL